MKQFSTTVPGSGRQFISRLRPYLAALLLLLAAPLARAQAPAWQSAVPYGAAGDDINTMATTVDAGGNVYLVGGFSGTVNFGSITLTSAGMYDIFVAKWSVASNRFVWAQRAGGTEGDIALAVAVSGPNVYVTGVFNGAAVAIGGTTLVNVGFGPTNSLPDAFVAKLTDAGSTGSFAWALRMGGAYLDVASAVAVTGAGVYVAGYFGSPTADFGSTVLVNSQSPSHDVFVAKLADAGSTGSFTWAQRAGSTDDEEVYALAVAGPSVYVAGNFNGSATIFGNTLLNNAGPALHSTDMYVAKLTDAGSSGSFTWAQRAGGPGIEGAGGLAVRGTNVYLTGYFGSPTIALGSVVLASAGSYTTFITKLTDAGPTSAFAWALPVGEAGIGHPLVNGNDVYVAGSFSSPTATFGPTTLANSSPASATNDVLVAKLTDAGASGSFVWAQAAGGPGQDLISGLGLTSTGSLVLTGYFAPPASFGAIVLPAAASGFIASLAVPVLATTPAGPLAGTSLYPNPAHATATVQVPPVPGATAATLTITDALGRVLRTATVPLPAAGLRHPLDLAGLPAGLYALRVAAGDRSATHRLVVE